MEYGIYEKDDHLALHGLFNTQARAEQFLRETIPLYVARGYFADKTLTADSFEVYQRALVKRSK